MDEAARKKYCRLLMFDVPPPSNNTKNSLNTAEMPFMIDCTTSLENSFRTQDNFVFTSFEPMRVKPQSPIKNKKSISYKKTIEKDTIIDESYQQSIKKIPRPPNAFILYRRAKQKLITKERSNAKISQLLAKMWRDETEEEKLRWRKIADRKKVEHMQAHPGYVYRPKRPISNDKRKRSKTTPSKQPISTLENTCVSELETSNVNLSTIESLVVFDNSSSYNHSFPSISPQESKPKEMNFNLEGGFNFLEQPKETNFNPEGGFNFLEQPEEMNFNSEGFNFLDQPEEMNFNSEGFNFLEQPEEMNFNPEGGFFLEQPKEMNFNSEGGFNFLEQYSQYSPYFFIDSLYNAQENISQEQMNEFIPLNRDPLFNIFS
ncbi:uncharacterized protein OCT59_026808 [Rhizophagus irregularis]|uniref:MATA-HMG n=4 Tax=Rhizophagus irregularis TaxID=588596 RepID=A0A1B1ETX1_9GLOM|nr:MATA-HMG [Rhizophagus irregularis]EXX55466.1 Rox1p [Rhizophagus irregularis DAOM 197198w]GBC16277.1 mating-type HMG-box protein MAT1-2 [Rhizophagus irregularis DAOM 181602=DAOM 197198]ANQ32257.1 MATA-HMG [Rhizophagus irregularis]ANQ32258.1 MATA-HMG [Rhizophagus irregularis]